MEKTNYKQNKITYAFFNIVVGIVLTMKGLGFTNISWEVLIGLLLIASSLFYYVSNKNR